MVIIKDNVERIISENDFPLYKKQGFIALHEKAKDTENHDSMGQKPLKQMTVAELKVIAEEKGIENIESLTKAELLKVLADHGCN